MGCEHWPTSDPTVPRGCATTLVAPIDAHEGLVLSVEFSQDGKRLVSGSDDKSVRIWD
ncbi:WD40 domain-containing protein [Rhizoctonia solani AG-1 IA]|uniref:WD40 domain-containing protein n=1 Tax=Thanatephorus cucumeris (strain AG1-IA) TaxID=983506 RepID=L8WIH3_THACA|nr:WD40 domain-containing protein [Rhizoctonia solani AG-1 IA]